MKLSQTRYDNSETGCCAKLDPASWDDKTFEWKDKRFLKDHIRSFLHVPLNFGSIISRDHAAVEEAAAYPEHYDDPGTTFSATTSPHRETTFLRGAVQIPDDGIGDDDARYESNGR